MRLDDILKPTQPKLTEDYEPGSVHCEFITGPAGSGKTYLQKGLIEKDGNYGILCATTGIAAVNLGATTLNSVLKYYDTNSLRDRFNQGRLTSTLHKLGKKTKRLVIDEISMMDGKQLDYIYQAILQVNEYQDMREGKYAGAMGIVLTGDFCQLPPVNAPWVFESECWEHFERNTTKLTKIWRQDNLECLQAINAARSGKGKECVEILRSLKVRFVPMSGPPQKFDGTTIMSKNDTVDNFNYSTLLEIPGDAFGLKTMTWGDQAGEWKNIPEMLRLKENAYVMILSNSQGEEAGLYANGDCGYIQSKDPDGTIWVKLVRNERLVGIRPIIRYKSISGADGEKMGLRPDGRVDDITELSPDEKDLEHEISLIFGVSPTKPRVAHLYCDGDCGWDQPGRKHGPWGQPSYNCNSGTWNVGAIKYYPLRLAYATTVHKSQGLTLDKCQIDCRDAFFSSPNMAYVALSRCRTPDGLIIVGDEKRLENAVKLEPKVRRFV